MPLPPIHTERLVLRPLEATDADRYHTIWGDPEVIWWGHSDSRAASTVAVAALTGRCERMPAGLGWSWLLKADTGELVGDVCLQPAPDPPGGIEIGWHLAKENWGRGYATEGTRPLLTHAWSLGIGEIVATIVPMNKPSVAVAERLGMIRRPGITSRGGLAHGVWAVSRPDAGY